MVEHFFCKKEVYGSSPFISIFKFPLNVKKSSGISYEFDPGSGKTQEMCLTHAN